jgi:creatinine amidohydrolase
MLTLTHILDPLTIASVSAILLTAVPLRRKAPPRSRYFTSLTNDEIARQLKKNDIIFLPIGPIEMWGALPVDCEYVRPLAYALKMAEEVDGLVLPNLSYIYTGATSSAEGSVYIGPTLGLEYFKEICRTLVRQGFRRIVLVTTYGTRASTVTLLPLVRDFFDETKCPIVWLDVSTHFRKAGNVDYNKMFFGAYSIVGRLTDIPLGYGGRKVPPGPSPAMKIRTGAEMGFFYTDPDQHAWFPEKDMTAEDRETWAKEGVAQIETVVKTMDMRTLVEDMRTYDKRVREELLPKLGKRLPGK